MRPKIAAVCAPEAIELILFWPIHQPVAGGIVGNTVAGNGGTNIHVRKAGRHDRRGKREGRADMCPNIRSQAREICLRINAGIDVDARCVR